jgi:cellulose synthase/poly-beta-1,6-N-acetylglucosamine synthase-like glycosyltransferase
MDKISFIIPARAERPEYIKNTLTSIYNSCKGEFEVILGYDGEPYYDFSFPNLKAIKLPNVVGIKSNINILAASATGKYLFKLDAHCSVGEGIDEILKADMQDDWIVMPRFYIIRRETWEWQDDRHYDYFFLCCPFTDPRGFRFKAGGHWPQRTAEREPYATPSIAEDTSYPFIDETPQIHGSGWFMTKDRFFELGGFPLIDPMGHAQEPANLALKNWLMGGKVMVNKKTWYAHLHQETRDKGFRLGHSNEERTYNIIANYWVNDKLPDKVHNFEWFVEKFMPMPTWPENWRELLHTYQEEHK